MAKKKFTEDEKKRMGILWVLLNCTIEYKGDSAKVCEVMDMIEKAYPDAHLWWSKSFQLIVDGKIVYDFNNGAG